MQAGAGYFMRGRPIIYYRGCLPVFCAAALRRRLFLPAFLAAGLLGFTSIALCQFEESGTSPLRIGRITVEQRNVFDESDSTLLRIIAPLANSVHILTSEEVIRRELLLTEGDPYDQRLADESARNLRRMGIIGDVTVTADTLPDNTVHVKVSSRDRWTLRPGVSLRQDDGVRSFAVSVREENLFGTAQKLRLGYNRVSDRTNPHGGELAFTEPRLWRTRWGTALQYRNADELRQGAVNLERPFFSDTARWAARGYADVSRARMRLYEDGLVTSEDYIDQETQLAWIASSSGSDVKLQLAAAYVRTRTRAEEFPLRPADNIDLLIGSVSLLSREYYQGSYLDNFGRVEDVPVGYHAGVAFGRNLHFTKAGTVDHFLRVFGQRNFAFGVDLFASYLASVSSYFSGWTPNEMTVSAVGLHHWRFSQHHTFVGRVAAVIGSRWAPSSQMTLGSSSGLRGYQNHQFSGQRMVLINLEHRAFSTLQVWFFRLGGALFFDSGAVWGQGEGFGRQQFHSSAGIGLRVESSKSGGSGIFRFDIAYNFDRRRVGIGFSSNHLFRAFSPMEFIPPLPDQPVR